MTPDRRPRAILRPTLALVALLTFTCGELTAQAIGSKRAVAHDDYDTWTSLSGTTYSDDGKWMAYVIKARVGDGVLYVKQVDGDKVYTFERGERVSFSNDNKLAMFKVGEAYAEERLKKLQKLHEKKEEKESGGAAAEEGLPPDIKAALAERGMPEAAARAMMEQRGSSIAEVRTFLGLPEPEPQEASTKKPQEKAGSEQKAKEEAEAKAKKALEQRVHVLDLATGEVTKIEQVKSYRQPKDSDLLVLHFEKPEPEKKEKGKDEAGKPDETGKQSAAETPEKAAAGEPPAAEPGQEPAAGKAKEPTKPAEPKKKTDPKEAKRSDGTKLVIRNLADNTDTTIEHVRSFGFLKDDTWMWYTVGTKKITEGVEHGLFARDLATGRTVTVLAGYSDATSLTTDESNAQVAFSSDLRTFGDKEPERDIYVWDFSANPARLLISKDTPGIPADYRIQASGLDFSRDGSVLTFGIKPKKPDDLPKILSEDEVKLDLWHWQDGLLQTMQSKRGDPTQATLMTVYHQDGNRAVVLGTPENPSLTLLTDDGSRALASDSSPYEHRVTWDGRYSDYYVVNTIDGSRTKIIEELRGSASRSTGGRYVIWFDHRDYDWHVYDLHTATARNLTADIGVAFDREQDDRPEPHSAHGTAGWTEGDAEVLIHDEFDLWAVNPETGAFRCVTDGLGRATNTSFRVTGIDLRPDAQRDDNERRRFVSDALVLRATNQDTYAEGYYTDSLDQVGRPQRLIMRDASIGNPTRPRDADRLFLTFSRFDQYPDVWTTDLAFDGARQLTDGCPQLATLRWGTAELVQWQSDDGVDLKGYLIKPDGFDPTRKYPMMVYFYERSSQGIHRFVTPSFGTSPNAAYYVSNGYLWFAPDIVYRDGYPGESCEKCVVSGVQHLIAQGFVDRKGIGAAGHSWGGYQTAHLITRTDIFAAVESGAPVVNMYSAYGGIRWSTGMSRQFQYEQTQSRIGGTIWEHPMRYWENSPLFHLDKARTPVLILHNDQDGAVPWYQGIEFFVAMRRLGKEAYLFNYNGEDHGLGKAQNQRDWTRRVQEFFDHHLKGAAAPDWMRRGVPYHERMAEKIKNAPSYREAIDAGLITPEGEPKKPTATPVEVPIGSGSSSGGAR